jgi:hypothetical protein
MDTCDLSAVALDGLCIAMIDVYMSLMAINKKCGRRLPIERRRPFILSRHLLYPVLLLSSALSRLLTRGALLPLKMLASPLYPTSIAAHQSSEGVSQYRPAKDIESFNKLLPPVVEFVEGSSSGTLLVAEGRYEPINASPKSSAGASEVRFPSRYFVSCSHDLA